jgi:hypothetical protein
MTCNPLVRWLERSFQLLGDLRLRALNLVWSLVESDFISCTGNGASKKKIAIVGGGFVGLTIAAGLIEKDVNAEITIFKERDLAATATSDSRWLHPDIYDWPGDAI